MAPRVLAQRIPPLVVALLAACSDSTGPDGTGRTLGILQLEATVAATSGTPAGEAEAGGEDPIRWSIPPRDFSRFPPEVIAAPRTAIVGERFEVTAYTVGPNGCWSADGMDVSESGRVIEITPWDRHSGGEACTMIFGYLGHPTTLTLDEVGEWTLRMRGRRVRGDGSLDDSVTADRTVLVIEDHDSDPPVEVTLPVSEEVSVDGVFGVAFVQVAEDSRCATDVVCVWEGNAAIVLGLTLGSGPTHSFTVNTAFEPDAAEHGGYRVTLLEVLPAPVSTAPIPPGSYRARLLVEKLP
ncbi:MAG: hypothetical protein WEG36_11965 [Gemmatimonadota bacterium]